MPLVVKFVWWIHTWIFKYTHSWAGVSKELFDAHVHRCQCYGHANSCDTTSQPYRCLCSQESFTEGLHVSSLFMHGNLRNVGGMLNINPLNLTWSNFSLWVQVNWYGLKLNYFRKHFHREKWKLWVKLKTLFKNTLWEK